MSRWHAALLLALALFGSSGAAACGDSRRTTVTIFAASSLTDAFTEAAGAFEASHPGVDVRLSFASSAALATQIREGARADLLATADPSLLLPLQESQLVSAPEPFASNSLVIVVASGNTPVQQFPDLASPGLRLVLAAPGVPLGDYSRAVLDRAAADLGEAFKQSVLANVRSEEASARATLAKIALGEADAALVYATDMLAAGDDIRAVKIPDGYQVVSMYASAIVTAGGKEDLAMQFQAFLLSEDGRAIFTRWGFGPPGVSPT